MFRAACILPVLFLCVTVASSGEKTEPSLPKEKWDATYLDKQWGLKLKSIKQTESGVTCSLTFLFEFSKDVEDLTTLQQAFDPKGKSPFTIYFFDEDNVVMMKGSFGSITGEITGKKGDAFRATLNSALVIAAGRDPTTDAIRPANLMKAKKAEFRPVAVPGKGADTPKTLPPPKSVKDPNEPNPPLKAVKGVIEKIDERDRSLVLISIGTDAGVDMNNTLEVYRLLPRPEFLGMIRIVEANPHKAIGRLMRGTRTNVQSDLRPGDEVSSQLRSSDASQAGKK